MVVALGVEAADLIPDSLPPRAAMTVPQEGEDPRWIAFECPCESGHRLLINLSPRRRPHWRLSGDWNAPTLHPSVDVVTDGHRCHFWLRAGCFEWADPPYAPLAQER